MLTNIIGNAADVIILVLLFGFTVFVHELGHFLVALRRGMVIDVFSIGFGPAIWKRTWRGVVYKIGCIPVGGYVALPQLDPAAMSAVQGKGAERQLKPIRPWEKILVSLAGATGNVLLAVGLAWIIYLTPQALIEKPGTTIGFVATNSVAYERGLRPGDDIVAVNGAKVNDWHEYSVECLLKAGQSNEVLLAVRSGGQTRQIVVPTSETEMGIQAIEGIEKAMHCVVADVLPGSVAEQAGLQAGDVIRTFDHVRVAGSQHFVALVASRADRTVPLLIERGGKKIELQVTPRVDPVQGRAMIGVRVGSNEMGAMPWMQYRRPLDQIKNDAMGIVRILKALVTPRESRQAAQGLGGPVMILATLWVSIQTSLLNAVGFLRFLNINLAILNLLPIPVLDGGHILIALWEGITRRRVNPRFVNALVNVFAALLIAVFILLTYRDFFRLSRFLRIFRERDERSPAAATNEPPAAPAQERVSP